MAILPRHPGFEVTIEVDGIPLPEYDLDEAHVEGNEPRAPTTTEVDHIAYRSVKGTLTAVSSKRKLIKYIQSPSSGEFTIRYKCRPNFGHAPDCIYLEPSLDGKTIPVPDSRYSLQDGCHSEVCEGGLALQDGSMILQRFKFTEPTVGMSI